MRSCARHLETIPPDLSAPYETEVNLAALKWIETLAQKLTRGYVLTVDYGYSRDEFYAPERTNGTLQCHAQHRSHSFPADRCRPGRYHRARRLDERGRTGGGAGLSVAGFTDQHHFITGVVTALMPEQFDASDGAGTRRALQTLLHPELLGTTFQFLALARNAPDRPLGWIQIWAGTPQRARAFRGFRLPSHRRCPLAERGISRPAC